MDGEELVNEGQSLDLSTQSPLISIEDLGIDGTKLTIFGQGDVQGINNREELDAVLRRDLNQINPLFNDKTKAGRMVELAEVHLNSLDSKDDLTDDELREKEGVGIVRDFARYALNGYKAEALLVIKRSARSENIQDAFAGNPGGITTVFPKDDSGEIDMRDAAIGFIELSRIMYADLHGGKPYQTKEQIFGLEQMKQRAATIKLS